MGQLWLPDQAPDLAWTKAKGECSIRKNGSDTPALAYTS